MGLFDPEMATEDIALSWKLQRRFYDIRYEPRAVVAMQVPETLRGLWRQRMRWGLGLAQVLRRHAGIFSERRTRRLWPVCIEACLSIAWAYTAVLVARFWAASYVVGLQPLGASPVPNFWGMIIATAALLQLAVGVWLDRHYNRDVTQLYLWAAMYPLFYWMLMIVITVVATPRAFLGRPQQTSKWRTRRVPMTDRNATIVEVRTANG